MKINHTLSFAFFSAAVLAAPMSHANFYSSAVKAHCYGKAAGAINVFSFEGSVMSGAMEVKNCLNTAQGNVEGYIAMVKGIEAEFNVAKDGTITLAGAQSEKNVLDGIEKFNRILNRQLLNSEVLKETFASDISSALESAKTGMKDGDFQLVIEMLDEAKAFLEQTKKDLN